ncbi:hypothetical protein [Clostridium ganghwense]|uniref:Peptidase n=1 Tax=Clostridium ganghwense TaxID=312089 RepID=A0ABT4CKB6_9CLOT|nr:hypothetical protein [Clostridium ganghwense]MCY6369490.1 hypothetical protein [Clostridium ganghwense]
MNKKKIVSMIICACLSIGVVAPVAYAKDADGKIDLYQVFSNKKDMMKNEVGSCIYKWSMHLPDDAVIYKSERVNSFNMSTKSYQSSVELEVSKNKDNLTLEEILYKMQNSSRRYRPWRDEDKEFVVDIAKDSRGEKYIRIIKANKEFSFFMMQEPEDELKDYVENRIYVANNYIYNLTISMKGEFYKQHEEMFDKLASSFKLSFDKNNKYIKELSDSVSTTREYKNKSYGWKMVMSPYWKLEGSPDARCQTFRPVYSDEELNQAAKSIEEDEDEFKVPEGITVNLISSSKNGETASQWAEKEIEELKTNYHKEAYDILKNESKKQGNMNVHHVVTRYKTVTKKPYIVHNVYVVGNGYKYLVSATMMEDKYQDTEKRSSFENMLNSFKLDKTCFSKYLGEIVSAKSLINLNAPKELKMKKYDFETKVTKRWNTSSNGYDFDDDFYFEDFYYSSGYRGHVSNDEHVRASEPASNMRVNMFAGLDTNEIREIIEQRAKYLLQDDEIRMGLAKVKIESAEYNGAKLYYIEKEYNLDAIKKFVNSDETKTYDLENLENEYTHIIKVGKDIYTQSVTLPVANMTTENKRTVSDIWKKTSINKIDYSKLGLDWKQHKLEEFDKEKTENANK